MTEPQKPKIALAMPARDTVCLETAHCLMNMIGRFSQLYIASGQADLAVVTVLGTLLPQMRNELVEQALKLECTHVLWVDSDMDFPADALEVLLKRNEAVVGVNYSQRKRPCKPTTAKTGEKGPVWVYGGKGLEEVEYVGHGLCLIETAVYEALPQPWYMLGWNDEKQRMIGEDVWFCRSLQGIGCPVYVDHDLSRHIKHVGTHSYTLEDAIADRPIIIEQQQKKSEEAKDGAE